ncbi:hypothetical protein CEXT_586231 [Caerostris extrusa]|uniref:Uncharacterized protein n=1 Tax=Caerostris extrusa TaxID=172846 RepID=A0AAV4WBP8_CAEEX|nr:hypothetical protein CEXT_586231 [Caerostris extrusa]
MNNENAIDHTTIEEIFQTITFLNPVFRNKQSYFPRKGIKVEEDEIETAISSVQFYDEVNETIELLSERESEENQTLCIVKDSNLEPTAELVDSRDIETDLGQANQEISVQETENVP